MKINTKTLDRLCEMGFKIENVGTYMIAYILDNFKEYEILRIMQIYKKTADAFETNVNNVVRNIGYAISVTNGTTNKQFILNLKREMED